MFAAALEPVHDIASAPAFTAPETPATAAPGPAIAPEPALAPATADTPDSAVREQANTVRDRPEPALPWMEPVEEDDGRHFDWGTTGPDVSDRWHYLKWALIALAVVIVAAAAATAFLMLRDGNSQSSAGTTLTTRAVATSTGSGATSTAGSAETNSTETSSTETPGTTAAEATSTTQAGVANVVDLSAKATLRASSTLKTSGSTSYGVANLIDGDPETCWAEGVKGYGRGEWFEFAFATPVTVSQIQVLPGYDRKTDDYDRWFANGRLKSCNLDFSDGSHKECTVKDSRTLQTITFVTPHTVTKVRVTITDVYPASEGKNQAEDTSVSEFHVLGTD